MPRILHVDAVAFGAAVALALALLAGGCGKSERTLRPGPSTSANGGAADAEGGSPAERGAGGAQNENAGGASGASGAGGESCSTWQRAKTPAQMHAVFGVDSADVWAVASSSGAVPGADTVLVHWDGQSWGVVSKVSAGSNALWASAEGQVWVVGDRRGEFTMQAPIQHWDGSVWSERGAPPEVESLSAVWGSETGELWAVGASVQGATGDDRGVIVRWMGDSWAVEHTTALSLTSIWGSSARDVWAVGEGAIHHFDGEAWTPAWFEQACVGLHEASVVWGSGPSDVWVGGPNLLHFDGKDWSVWPSPLMGGALHLAGSGEDDVWAVDSSGRVAHWQGAGWSLEHEAETRASGLWASQAGDLWIVGSASEPLHYGCELPPESASDGDAGKGLVPVEKKPRGGPPADPACSVGGWCTRYRAELAFGISDIWGSGPDDVWAVGRELILHWDGTAWTSHDLALGDDLNRVWGAGPNDVWAVGNRTLHWNGQAWRPLEFCRSEFSSSMGAVFGFGPNHVLAASQDPDGSAQRWDGKAWSNLIGSPPFIYRIWGSSPSDVWVAGHDGLLAHFDGEAWSEPGLDQPPITQVYGLWGSGADDVWAVGSGLSIAQHWDGSSWTNVDTGAEAEHSFRAVWGSGPDDVWLVGSTIRHWDGEAWSYSATNTFGASFNAVWGSGPGDVWVVSDDAILHRDGP